MRAAGLGIGRTSLVILWDIVLAKELATMKVDKELVRFQSGWLAIVSLRGLLRQTNTCWSRNAHHAGNGGISCKQVRFLLPAFSNIPPKFSSNDGDFFISER